MQFPRPEAVIRVHVVEAKGLQGKDWRLFSEKTSDPYAVLKVGGRQFKTEKVTKTVNPKWGSNEVYDFFMFNKRQKLFVELLDHDYGTSDDSLGTAEPLLAEVAPFP